MSIVLIEFSEHLKQEKIFDPEKANAFDRALNDEMSDQLSTKSDLVEVDNRMQIRIAQMENRLIKWMIGLALAATAINVTVTGFLVTL